MMQYVLKVTVTAVLVVGITEAAKRWTLLGAVLASIPLTSVLAMVWLYIDTKSVERVGQLSWSIFWVVIPSLAFFLLMPVLIKWGVRFWPSLVASIVVTAATYWVYVRALRRLGVEL